MGQSRRQFTDEFKREAVALLASSGRPLTQIAEELGIAPSMLRNWPDRSGGRNAGPALRPNTPASAPHSVPDPAAERPCHGNYRRAERGQGQTGFMLRRHLATAPPLRLGRSAAWTGRRGVVED
jgi:transposase